jgi:hypothetical protein
MASVAATAPPGFAVSVRKAAAKAAARAYATAKAGAASAVGVCGLASLTVAAALTDPRLGWAVGGVLAVWLASLLPDTGRPGGRR